MSLPLLTMSVSTPSLAASSRATIDRVACAGGLTPVLAPRSFVFPRDHGAHDNFPIEWWRTFGRVTDDAGKRFDFNVNVSRFRLDTSASSVHATDSRWSSRWIVTTVYAILDEQTLALGRGTFVDRQSAFGARIGGDDLSIVAKAIAYKQVRNGQRGAEHFELDVRDATSDNALSIVQTPTRDVLPLGPGGIMRTGSCESNEAYAYAYPRNATSGIVRFDGVDHRVAGSTWFEHEFAQRELAANDAGWNRFELQFDDGRDIDARFTRDARGNVVATSGAFVAADGTITYLTSDSVETQLPPEARERDAIWHSDATNLTYPAMWYFVAKPGHLRLATVEMTHDQEIRGLGRTPYYWGAIAVEKYGPPGGDLGHGFVELTGYGGRRVL